MIKKRRFPSGTRRFFVPGVHRLRDFRP